MATPKKIQLKAGKKLFSKRLLPLASSLFVGIGFLNVHLGGLVLVGLVPFIYYAIHAVSLSHKQILFDCWLAALTAALIASAWNLQTVPATWVDLHGGISVAIKIIVWLMIALCASFSFGLVTGTFISRIKDRPVTLLIMLPLIWALAELVRSYSLAILLAGPGSSLSPNWNFGALGLAVASTPLAYLSRFVGLYGLSVVAVIINLALYLVISKRYKPALAITTTIVLLDLLAWQLYSPRQGSTVKVAAVYFHDATGSINPWKHIGLPAKDTAVLVLPEYSHFFENHGYQQFAHRNFGSKTIVVSTQISSGHLRTNDLLYYSNKVGFISNQPKTFLAPYGEYMPYSASVLLKLFEQQAVLNIFQRDSQIQKGSQPEHSIRANSITVGGLACSGVLNLNEYRRLAHQGADVLTNSASLSLLSKASLYRVQELYQNRFHAIANAKPLIQSSRSGTTYIISANGQMIARADDRSRLIEASVQLQPKRTVYSWLP